MVSNEDDRASDANITLIVVDGDIKNIDAGVVDSNDEARLSFTKRWVLVAVDVEVA